MTTVTDLSPAEAIGTVRVAAADLEARRGALARVREKAERAVREASEAVEEAEAVLAERHRAAVAAYGEEWGEYADRLEVRAEECPADATTTYARVNSWGEREPVFVFQRDELAQQAAAARREVDRLGQIAEWRPQPGPEAHRSEVMHRQTLSRVCAGMVMPPGDPEPTPGG